MNYRDKIITYLTSGRRGKAANHLEREAMGDAFLNDALDGFSSAGDNTQVLTDIEKLQRQLAQRASKPQPSKRKHVMRWVATSAAVLLVFVTGYWALRDNSQPEHQLAVLDEQQTTSENTNAENITENELSQSIFEDKQADSKISADKVERSAKKSDAASFKSTTEAKAKSEEFIIDDEHQPEVLKEIKETPALADESVAVTERMTEVVISKPSEKSALSPPSKDYSYQRDASSAASKINAESIMSKQATNAADLLAYQTANQSPPNFNYRDNRTAKNQVQAEEEVVALGFGKQKDVARSSLADSLDASKYSLLGKVTDDYLAIPVELEPVAGIRLYTKLLTEQLVYPANARQQKIEGDVTLSFLIDAKGRPHNITVEKGINADCDKEAIRLVTNGGNWIPSANNPQKRVTLKVSFKL